MGKKRHGSPRECYESLSDGETRVPGRFFEELSHKSRHKKTKKNKHCNDSDSNNSELESARYEKRKHKHRHRRRNREKSCNEESPTDESEKESRYSTHRKKRHRDHSKYEKKKKNDRKDEEPISKWDEDIEQRIKIERTSDNECQRSTGRSTNTETQNTREQWGKQSGNNIKPKVENAAEKEKINFGLSGKLTEDANTYNGVVIKYTQPPEARKPKRRWRWYIFKGDDELPFLPLHRQSAYLIGRERKIADIPTDHPSCSKQHAVFQYRLVSYDRVDGTKGRTVKPYILDLESANGTYVNNRRIESRRYVELLEKDVVKFGYSSREYVLLHEASKGSEDDEPSQDAISPISLLRRE